MNLETVREGFELMERGMRVLGGGPLDYYMRRLTDSYELLLERYAPFRPGDRVALAATPDINPHQSWGWMGSKHFLIKGAKGTVRSVEADRKGFSAAVEFDDESWVDSYTKAVNPTPEKDRHTFWFTESWLIKL